MAQQPRIKPEEVAHMARLSRLSLSPEEQELFTRQLGDILDYMDVLNEIDVSGVEPLYSPVEHAAEPRQDIPVNKRSRDEIFANAPDTDGEYFIVPRIV